MSSIWTLQNFLGSTVYVLNLQKASCVNVFIPLHEMVLAAVCLSQPQALQQTTFHAAALAALEKTRFTPSNL